MLFTLDRWSLDITMRASSDMSHANNCDAVPQELPSRWCVRLLALILSNHIDRGSAVQSPDAVFPDWNMLCTPWLPALNVYHHETGYDPCILVAGYPWTFRKFHSLAAFDMASATLSAFLLSPWSRHVTTRKPRRFTRFTSFPTLRTILFTPGFHHARHWDLAWFFWACEPLHDRFGLE